MTLIEAYFLTILFAITTVILAFVFYVLLR